MGSYDVPFAVPFAAAYHWDTSDWMPSTRLSDIQEVPRNEACPASNVAGSSPCPEESTHELESDYYLGGYDIDSDYPLSHEEEFLSEDQNPPPLPTDEDFSEVYTPMLAKLSVSNEGILSSGSNACHFASPDFLPNQYRPSHPLDLGEMPQGKGVTAGNVTDSLVPMSVQLSVGASLAPENLTRLDYSEHGIDLDSMVQLRRGETVFTDSQQQTEV